MVSELEQCDCGMYEYSAAPTGADRRVGPRDTVDVIMVAVRPILFVTFKRRFGNWDVLKDEKPRLFLIFRRS